MIDKTTINKICRDFDIPFNVHNIEEFDKIFPKYCSYVDPKSEENKNINTVKEIISKLKEIAPYLESNGYGIDILSSLRHDFVDFIHSYLRGEKDAEAKELYDKFNTQDMNAAYPLKKLNIPNGDVYNQENIGKKFISIDMSKAAFQAFYIENPKIVLGCDDYFDFVNKMFSFFIENIDNSNNRYQLLENTNVQTYLCNYVAKSRNIRQVIFGKTNGSRLCHIEKYVMQSAYTSIMDVCPNANILKFCNDEIIFEYTPEAYDAITSCIDRMQLAKFKVEAFELGSMKLIQHVSYIYPFNTVSDSHELGGIIVRKRIDDDSNSFAFKCCPAQYRYMANKFISTKTDKILCADEYKAFMTVEVNGFIATFDGVIYCETVNI